MDEAAVEQEIKDKGLTAPRITPEHIDKTIVDKHFYRFPETTTTVCMLTLTNGYSVVGKSACADTANFDAELGEKLAFDNARNQVWALEGYLLREGLFVEEGKG